MNQNLVDMAVIEAQQALIRELRAENTALKADLERTQYHLAAARAERQDRDDEANALSLELERLELEVIEARGTIADKQTAYNIQRHMAQRHAARAAQAIAALEAIGFEFVAAAFVPTTPDSE